MNNAQSIEIDLNGKTLKFETGVLAKQANGSALCQLGETIVFSAVTAAKTPREGIDFFPLQVEYREKFYAAGRFPGGYFKREARPSEKEILTARVTDRPIRPLFPEGYYNDVQINNMLVSADGINESDILCINVSSMALTLSEIPFYGPIGAVRVGRVDGEFIVNPTHEEMEESDLDLVYVGTRELPVMIEGTALEIAEADIVQAMKTAHTAVEKIVDAQLELRKQCGLPEKVIPEFEADTTLIEKINELCGSDLEDALTTAGKTDRSKKIDAIKEKLAEALITEDGEVTENQLKQAFDKVEIDIVRRNILEKSCRIDGRGCDELRQLDAQIGMFPRTHGSSIFARGETQAMAMVTLGSLSDAQEMDGITGGADEKRFMLHYNFPPYSVGEVGRLGSTGRREIGHGALAEKSLKQMLPDEYPYTIRIVSEIMGSNGSSSMASICAGSLALMDAGVPIKKPVAGISIGLVTGDNDQAVLLTDIIGSEDHCGDMDFKVGGTRDGITGFQVDLKLRGLKWELVEGAFQKAREARLKILDYMAQTIDQPRAEMSRYAPRIEVVKINPEKIGALIGPGGKNIRRITDTTGVQIDIEDDGTVNIFSNDGDAMKAALEEVNLITAEAEIGKIYRGTVKGIKDFGAFVEILPGKEGLVHISELANFRVKSVEDIVKMGEQVWVKCIDVDNSGKIRLSRKAALEEKDAEGSDSEE